MRIRVGIVGTSGCGGPSSGLVYAAMGAIDNLGKGATGQAVQATNMIFGLPETAGLDGSPVWR